MTMTLSMPTQEPRALPNKSFMEDKLWDDLVEDLLELRELWWFLENSEYWSAVEGLRANDEQRRSTSERILNETVGFLRIVGLETGQRLSISKVVDFGWHAFLLRNTRYNSFCESLPGKCGGAFGKIIGHHPISPEAIIALTGGPRATVEVMKRHMIPVDEELWPTAAKCSDEADQCGGCGP